MSAQDELYTYLNAVTEMRRRMAHPRGISFMGIEDFVLKEGRYYGRFFSHHNRYVRRPSGFCFDNSYRVASNSRGKLLYVEGYATGKYLCTHHAWCIDKDGSVVDVTWGYDHEPAYLGVAIDLAYMKAIRTRDNCSALDNWENDYPLLRNPKGSWRVVES